MKMINSHPHSTPREENLKKFLRLAIVQFLESNLPQFNMLSNQLIKFLNAPEMIGALKDYEFNKVEAEKQEQNEKRLEEHRRVLEQQSRRIITKSYNPFADAWLDTSTEPSPKQTDRPRSVIVPTQKETDTNILSRSVPTLNTPPKPTPKGQITRTQSAVQHRPSSGWFAFLPFGNTEKPSYSSPDRPSITIVKPVVVPTFVSAMINIQGDNFNDGLRLIIGGVRIPPENIKLFMAPGQNMLEIQVKVPPINSPGPKTIILINPDAKTAILENVLTYIDDDNLARSFDEREKKKNIIMIYNLANYKIRCIKECSTLSLVGDLVTDSLHLAMKDLAHQNRYKGTGFTYNQKSRGHQTM